MSYTPDDDDPKMGSSLYAVIQGADTMKAPRIRTHEASLLEALRYAVHGLSAPFVCGGTLVPDEPLTLCFKDKTQLPVLRASSPFEQEQHLRSLVARCTPAPFGKGRRTRYNRSVRHALQLKAEGDAFSVLNFDPATSGILEQIRHTLLPQDSAPLIADLYNLNIYARDGHFLPHKDTPRGSDMIGTLVVCLPAQFSNGALVVKHQGVLQTFDWSEAIREQAEPTRLHWAAFFGDVDHQIEQVWSGLRITLTYLLRRGTESEPLPVVAPEALPTLVHDTLRVLLADRRFLPKGGTLAFPCSHLYHQDARFQRQQRPLSRRTVSTLKGRDALVAAAALAEGLQVTFCPYLIETCADETWQLGHFPTLREQQALEEQMDSTDLEEALDIRGSSEIEGDFGLIWVDPPPHFNGQPTMYPDVAAGSSPPQDPELPALAYLHTCEYSATGYFGNEGSDIDLYIYGALHVVIPPYGEGSRVMGEDESPPASSSTPRQRSVRKKRG
jgi:hypothetical protein